MVSVTLCIHRARDRKDRKPCKESSSRSHCTGGFRVKMKPNEGAHERLPCPVRIAYMDRTLAPGCICQSVSYPNPRDRLLVLFQSCRSISIRACLAQVFLGQP